MIISFVVCGFFGFDLIRGKSVEESCGLLGKGCMLTRTEMRHGTTFKPSTTEGGMLIELVQEMEAEIGK